MISARPIKQKPCKGCQSLFTPARPLARVCSPHCAKVVVDANNAKKAKLLESANRKETRARLEEMKTIAQLIADAQIKFNAFIRARDKDKGCFVCGRPFRAVVGQVQHAGHVRSRSAAGHLRFNEDNCHGECEGCNGPHGAKPHQIKAGAIARIGVDRWEALENDNMQHKWDRDELIGIKKTYAAKARALKEVRA